MKNFILQLFAENGSVSMVRMLSLISVLTASFIALYATYSDKDLNAISILCGTFLGAGIGGKVAQKFAENKT